MSQEQHERLRLRHSSLQREWRQHFDQAATIRQGLAEEKDRLKRLSMQQRLRHAEEEMQRLEEEMRRLEEELTKSTKTNGSDLSPESITPPADLDLRVRLLNENGRMALHYVLHTSNSRFNIHHKEIPGPTIVRQPEEYQGRLFEAIEKLKAGQGTDGSLLLSKEVASELEGLGRELYSELFPPEFRSIYREIHHDINTVQITSDEPWIPWELVKPYDDSESKHIVDDDYWCGKFQLTRWLAGAYSPPARINVIQLACIESASPRGTRPLPGARKECELVAAIAARHPRVKVRSVSSATFGDVHALLVEGGIQLFHFTGHGQMISRDTEPGFVLSDLRTLKPQNLHGPVATKIKEDRPLVFFNACRLSQQAWSLTRLGGWADRWVSRCGCGAFVGPQWTISDGAARRFAEIFYGALEEGKTFGQAALDARQEIKKIDKERTNWLAYAVYAHPNGKLLMSGG